MQRSFTRSEQWILCFIDRASLYNLFQMKPAMYTVLLSIFISTSVHVSGNYVPIIRRTYCLVCCSRPDSHPYLLTPWCRVLLEKLTGLQLVKKFPASHETRRFITALTSVRHLSLSWANPIQSIYPHPTAWKSVLILSTHLHLGLPSGSLPPVSPPRHYTPPSPHPYAPHAQPISFFSILSPAQYATHTEWKIPVSHRYNMFSWWWAHSCPKHVQKLK